MDLVREAVRIVFQELIEAEAAESIGAGLYERSETRTNEPTVTGNASCPQRPATSASASQSSERGASFPPSSSQEGGSTRRSTRS